MYRYPQFFLQLTLVFSCLLPATLSASIRNIEYDVADRATVARVITVDQSGKGDFKHIQQAIDSIPSNNNDWIQVQVKAGIYNEKVMIPADKPKIALSGESSKTTIIQFEDGGSSVDSHVLQVNGENFLGTDIQIKNTYSHPRQYDSNGRPVSWAPAALITSDMVAFYRCDFISVQDTISDVLGRHYFQDCYIEGAIDFIWGNGQSVYKKCWINATTLLSPSKIAYVTAQGRNSTTDPTGFVFINCTVDGTGPTYLGRAYGTYSRVIYYDSFMSNVVVPEGWSSWNQHPHEDLITYVEESCRGPGADKTKRVKWMKTLSEKDLSFFINVGPFIGQWKKGQPKV